MRVCSVCGRCYEPDVVSCTEEGHPDLCEIREGNCDSIIRGYRLRERLRSHLDRETFRAIHLGSGRTCIINIHPSDRERAERFLEEAKAASTLFDPNIADIYEAGTLDTGELYVIAEDASGLSLSELLKTGVPELMISIEIVRQAAEALHQLHLKGLVHGAINSRNILVNQAEGHPTVKLTNVDFGGVVGHSIISDKFLIDDSIEQLRYFSPEQCSGEQPRATSDVYSLGIVLYELLSGAVPFASSKAAGLIEKHKNERPPDIWIGDFELRMLITHALNESLGKRPDKRQSSANALARQLRHIEQLATHVSTPPPALAVPQLMKPAHKVVEARAAAGPVKTDAPIVDLDPAAAMLAAESRAISAKPDRQHAERSRLKMWRKKLRHQFAFPVEPAPIQKEPKKIQWQQPDEDIPTVDDVLEALASEGAPQPDLLTAQEPLAAATDPVMVETAVKDAPNEIKAPEIIPALPNERQIEPIAAEAVGAFVEYDEREEITHVRPPKPLVSKQPPETVRFRVPVTRSSNEIYFVPTILGGDVDLGRSAATDASDTLLSAFYSPTSGRSLPYRAFAAGGAALVVIGLVLFGNSSVWRFASAEHSDNAGPSSTTAKVLAPATTTSFTAPATAKKKPVKTADKATKENADADAGASKGALAKETTSDKRSEKAPVRQPSQKVSATPKIQTQKDLPENRVLIISNKPAVFTRPRVVKNARP